MFRQLIALLHKPALYEKSAAKFWEHTFTKNELLQDLSDAGFTVKGLYGNIAGIDYCEDGKEMCIVAGKEVK